MTRQATPPSRTRFENRAAAGRRRSLRRVLLAAAAAVLVAALAWVVLLSPLLAVETVRVEGVAQEDSGVVLAAAGVPLGTALVRLDSGAIADRVRGQVPFVQEVSVTRAWPRTLVVQVSPRAALLAVRGPGGEVGLVDEHGVRFRSVPMVPAGLPAVTVSVVPPEGASDSGLQAAAEALRALGEQRRSQISELAVSSANRVTFRLNRVSVVWGGPGQAVKKVAVLDALLATRPATVDVSAPDLPVTT